MKKVIAIFVLLLILVSVLSACSSSASPAATGANPAGDSVSASQLDGEALVNTKCTQCHDLNRVTSEKQTEAQWTRTVDNMVKKGLSLTDAERTAIIGYLAETYK